MFSIRISGRQIGRERERERERGSREKEVQGGGGVVDDVGAEGEEGAVEEVEDRHLAAAVVSGVCAAARAMRLRPYVRICEMIGRRGGVIGLESPGPKYVGEC
jgi:hypothetical protein